MIGKYTYLLLDIGTLLGPLMLSFDKRVAFYRYIKYLIPAMVITGIVFIVWDVIFTREGVWEFNEQYITGIHILNLPLEEWLFFIVVPYACTFIYAVLPAYFRIQFNARWVIGIYMALIAVLTLLALLNTDKAYTSINFGLGAIILLLIFTIKTKQTKGWYLVAYVVSFFPFFLVNGVLTALPVVIYNNMENLSLRMYTIPVEDSIYAMTLIFMNYSMMDFFIFTDKTTTVSRSL